MQLRRIAAGENGDVSLEHWVAKPAQRRYGSPLLLLHDAWHGAWCWEAAQADLAQRGFEAHAISFRSHGRSTGPEINHCSIPTYLSDLQAALAAISPAPIVVAHGMAGFVVQYALSRGVPMVAAVLLCSMPPQHGNRFVLRWLARHPLVGARGLVSANSSHLLRSPELVRDAFFLPETPDEVVRQTFEQLQPESAQALTLMSREIPVRAHETHLLVLGAERDRLVRPSEVEYTARRQRAELAMIPGAPHDLMLEPASWAVAAALIEEWVQELARSSPA
jgi:pimeloyl-ACP methyl ester carboxylesterase